MLYREHSVCTPACQCPDVASGHIAPPVPPSVVAWTDAGTVDTPSLIAAVARAYNDVYGLTSDVTPTAILAPGRAIHVAQARHLCAYVLVGEYHLTNAAAARVLGRGDHSTAVNSRARIAAALPRDARLARVLDRARADLAGHRHADDDDEEARARRDAGRQRALATVSRRDWDEARYWRLQAVRRSAAIW
jgi:hypothetical protein